MLVVTRCSGEDPAGRPERVERGAQTPHSTDPSDGDARQCEWCGDEFEPYRDWQRFCPGGTCRKAWHRKQRLEEAKEKVVEQVMEEVREAVTEAVEEAFENLKV